ncbi:MAG: MarR family transcriptional regulator [Aquabacterium sp.]|nr:MarR family transcriptional regulator [Aquabacterium sp.]
MPALPADPLSQLDFRSGSLGYTLRLTQVRVYGLFFEMLGDLGLTPARVTALSIIATCEDMNQAELARSLNIAGPSALKMVDALEDAGLICRLDVQGDRRRYALALTATGRSKLEHLRERMAEYEERIAAGLSSAERAQLIKLLNRTAPARS